MALGRSRRSTPQGLIAPGRNLPAAFIGNN
jgi:hypothetical protein